MHLQKNQKIAGKIANGIFIYDIIQNLIL